MINQICSEQLTCCFLHILHMSLYPIEVTSLGSAASSQTTTDVKHQKKMQTPHNFWWWERQMRRFSFYKMEDWRAFFHISGPFDFFFFLSLGFVFFCRRSAQNSSVSEMMICDSNYVKKVDTCKGASNWNRYTRGFITNRQLINTWGAVRLTRVSFTQLPVSLDSGLLHYSKTG